MFDVGRLHSVSMASLSSKLFAAAQKRIPGGVNSPVRAFRNVGSAPFFIERAEARRYGMLM